MLTKQRKDLSQKEKERILEMYNLLKWIHKKMDDQFIPRSSWIRKKLAISETEYNHDLSYLIEHGHITQDYVYYSGKGYDNRYIPVFPPFTRKDWK